MRLNESHSNNFLMNFLFRIVWNKKVIQNPICEKNITII
jgi:hypothetical protein